MKNKNEASNAKTKSKKPSYKPQKKKKITECS